MLKSIYMVEFISLHRHLCRDVYDVEMDLTMNKFYTQLDIYMSSDLL